jgi:UDP-N-acetylmuramate-alanine ligase
MAENICGAFAMAAEIGIDTNIIVQSIANFKGIKRRLEKKYEGFITIYDDLAHSPAKVSATLKTLKFIYPTNNIIAIFEPNTGNRKSQSIPGYAHAFVDANEVIIPTLTKLKVDEKDTDPPFDGRTLCDIIAKNHTHALYIENDPALLAYIKEHTKKEDVVVFLGSHGFRGMIDELVRSYEGK